MDAAYLVLEYKRHIAFLLTWHKAIQQHRKATYEGLCDCAWPCLADDHITCCHPLRHVVHKAFDGDLQLSLCSLAVHAFETFCFYMCASI